MSLFSTLNLASNGLSAQQLGVQTAGANVANANTPGYARRTLRLEALDSSGGAIGGVRAVGTTRVDDALLRQSATRADSDNAEASTKADWLGRIEALRAPTSGSPVASAVDKFSDAFAALAAHPEDKATRQSTLAATENVARAFRSANDDLANIKTQMNSAVDSAAERATQLASELAALNARIAETPGAKDTALIDRRDAVASQLAAITGGSVIKDNQGHINVHGLGTMLVDGIHSLSLSTRANATTGTIELVAQGFQTQTAVLTGKATTGEIGALLSVRNGTLTQQQTQLDQLAFDFGAAANGVHAAGYGLDGSTGRQIFNFSATATGAANSFTMAPGIDATTLAASQSATTLPGDNRNAMAMSELRAHPATNFAEHERSIVAGLSSAAHAANNDADAASARQSVAQSLLTEHTGVSLDEEYVSLQAFQRAYQASAKVLSTVNELFDTLMSLKP